MKISQKLNRSIWFKLLLFIPLFLLLLVIITQYQPICELGGRLVHAVSLKTFIDTWIPTNVYIMLPYIACLVYVPFSGIFYAFNRRISAIQVISLYVSAILMYLACYAIFLVFPTTAIEVMMTNFNPHIVNYGMFQALQVLYTASTPLGDFPSLHVAPMIFMGIFLYKYWRSLFWIYLPFAFFGGIGTVVLKFHTFVGLAGGIAMGIFGYYILYERVVLRYLKSISPINEVTADKNHS